MAGKIILDKNGINGFTVIEIVAVLIVLGILAAVAVSRFSTIDADTISDFEKVKSHLRFAQAKAMANSEVRWGIQFSGTTYSLFGDINGNGSIDSGERFVLPGEETLNAPLESLSATGIVAFDWWGSPFSDIACNTPRAGGSFSLGSKTITITPETGFIP
jgi:prepilin-type N-terminal cleavage/methylation domain-containing protein